MIAVIGILIVFAAILGGFWLEGGPLIVLVQPAELLIIFGAAFGSFLISASRSALRKLLTNLKLVFFSPHVSREDYLDLLSLLALIFSLMRREGLTSVEEDVEHPESSPLFGRFPSVAGRPEAVTFIADTLRVYLTTGDPAEIDSLMKIDMDAMTEGDMSAATSLERVAESLPGLGIVAAVLGVVLAMGKINAPPEVLGHAIAAALIGTFLGVLGCYGLVGPMGAKLESLAQEKRQYFQVIREAVAASVRGSQPLIAVEYGRRAIPVEYRPDFDAMEQRLRAL